MDNLEGYIFDKSQRVNIGGLLFDNVTMDEALAQVDTAISLYKQDKISRFALVANQDIINKKKLFKDMSDGRLNKSFLTFADGYSIVVAGSMLHSPIKERVAGPDLMKNVIKNHPKDYGHFFIGASDGVAQKMVDNLSAQFGELNVSGIYVPPFCKEFSQDENDKMIKMINDSKCHILWVSFGCPKQERWIVNNIDKLQVPIALGVGAAFDFHSGNVKRAPLWMQKMKLEWFYRIFQDPKRLFARYFNGGVTFYKTIKKQKREMKKSKHL